MKTFPKTPALLIAILLAAPAAAGPLPASAQQVTLDEGEFTVFLDGREVGTETFFIRRSGAGESATVVAHADVELELPSGLRKLAPALEASGPGMLVTAYQVRVTGDVEADVQVVLSDRRYLARIRSERGEQQREFRVRDQGVLLERQVAHQYYFLASAVEEGEETVPVILPRTGEQFDAAVRTVGTTSLEIGGESVSARHLRVEGPDHVRDVWVDDENRVLRVEIASEGYRAVRTEPPA